MYCNVIFLYLHIFEIKGLHLIIMLSEYDIASLQSNRMQQENTFIMIFFYGRIQIVIVMIHFYALLMNTV